MSNSNAPYPAERGSFAYELKFLLPLELADPILSRAASALAPDPNSNGSGHGSYWINSLYFDTDELDVFHRNGSYGRCKYRVRRYGTEETLFLERKLKRKGRVGKRRTRVSESELPLLVNGFFTTGWIGDWFHRRLHARKLLPKCQIRYHRSAWVGLDTGGPVRLTLDRSMEAFPTDDLAVTLDGAWTPLLTEKCILEMKFRSSMPAFFKEVTQQWSLQPEAASKYRLSVRAFGWVQEDLPTEPADEGLQNSSRSNDGASVNEPPF
jgi:VTC domain